jgi:hypothetical protein
MVNSSPAYGNGIQDQSVCLLLQRGCSGRTWRTQPAMVVAVVRQVRRQRGQHRYPTGAGKIQRLLASSPGN